MTRNTFSTAALLAVILGVAATSSAMAISLVPAPSFGNGRTDGCGAEVARYAHIRVDAEYLNSIDGSEPIRLVDICTPTSLTEDLYSSDLAQYGNVTGLHNVIAQNPVLASELSANRYDASHVVAVVPGKGATYLMVHSH